VITAKYQFTDKEIDTLLKEHLTIIVDSREQENQHILDYFNKQKVRYIVKKLDAGDYSVMLAAAPDLGLPRDLYFPVMIEKKNSVDELVGSFTNRTRFEAEFIRAKGKNLKTHVLIEDNDGYANIINHNYRSDYAPKALLKSLKAFEHRYNFDTVFHDKIYAGNYIYHTLYAYLYGYLKG